MGNGRLFLVALCSAVVLAAAAPAVAKTVVVNCGKGESIQSALEDKAEPLIVEIQGKCQEAIMIRRSGLTLRGTDPATDGIRGPAGSVLVQVQNQPFDRRFPLQFSVSLENLAIENSGGSGFFAHNSRVGLTNVWITGNSGGVAFTGGSSGGLEDCRLENNGGGISVAQGSRIVCFHCEIHGNGGFAGFSDSGGLLFLNESNVSGPQGFRAGGVPFSTFAGGTIDGFDTDVVATAGPALSALQESSINWQQSTLDGRIEVAAKSQVNLLLVTQPAGIGTNLVRTDSTLTALLSDLARPLVLETFGNGVVTDSTVGTLTCASGADLVCEGTVTKTSSTCSLCP